MRIPTDEWLVAALVYSDRLAKDELKWKANDNSFRAGVLGELFHGVSPEQILLKVRKHPR